LPLGCRTEGKEVREIVAGAEALKAVDWRMKFLFGSILVLVALVLVVRAFSHEQTNGKLKIGDPIPQVTANDQDGKPVDLAEAGKSGYLLIYFYPKAMTPGCTAQACSLRDAYTDLQNKGVKVIGVSLDTVDSQKEFSEKEHLPFELLSDREKKITSAFGVPLLVNGFATRQAYLFKEGKLVWMDTHASTDKQASDVLAVLAQQS
jgi:thioredoxin-dependent peroxiredoxin